jgi:hypothetical protein
LRNNKKLGKVKENRQWTRLNSMGTLLILR